MGKWYEGRGRTDPVREDRVSGLGETPPPALIPFPLTPISILDFSSFVFLWDEVLLDELQRFLSVVGFTDWLRLRRAGRERTQPQAAEQRRA